MNDIHPVALIGAGPGDPELMTFKAVKRLSQADVVLIDDLVNPLVLEHCNERVRIKNVGKRAGCTSTPQEFIQRLMIREARAGFKVVRLKGGDCTIFARAGEEIEALHKADIPVELINGISSAQAAAAALTVSLTHRHYAQGVVFVTAHAHDDQTQIPWAQLAKSGMTLAFFMGVNQSAQIEASLVASDLPSNTPIAIIENVSLPNQRIVTGCIGQLNQLVITQKIQSPAQILVGRAINAPLRLELELHPELQKVRSTV